jgi:hypothetical protein
MHDVLGFEPSHTTAEAFADFARAVGSGRLRERLTSPRERVSHA